MPLASCTRPIKILWRRKSALNEISSIAASIPAEIILEIANNIVHPKDILSFGLQSRRLLSLMLPLLYAILTLQSNTSIRKLFSLFLNRPELARHIRELTLRPNFAKQLPPPSGGYLDEMLVAEIVERLAIGGNLNGLRSFVWEGLEGPKDRLWLTLRNTCPLLNKIGSSVGLRNISSDSHLCGFSNLISFSFVIKWRDSQPAHIHEERLPATLWKMLISRCPDLQDLTFGGPTMPLARIFDVRPLTAARWPSLRSLTLGDVKLQQDVATQAEDSAAFSLFLQAHPTLESLTLHRVGAFIPASLGLPRCTLPRLTFLCGTLYHVHDLPNPAKLKTLCLTSTHYTSFYLYDLLRFLTSLTSLSIWIDLSQTHSNHPTSGDHGTLFHSILATCPSLLYLEILCSTHPSSTFSYKELVTALRMRPSHLRTLSITKLPHASDSKQLTKTASTLALDNHNLSNITLRRACEQWSVPGKMLRLKEAGTFVVVKNLESVPVALEADEWRVGLFGRGKVFRRYKCDLKGLRASE